MSKRKSHNLKARIDRSCRSLLATNRVAVVNIDPSGHQDMINYKSLKNIAPGKIGQAVCGIAHRWTIYLSAMCRDGCGVEYVKSVEISPEGIYKVERLTDAIEHYYLVASAGSRFQRRCRLMRRRPRSCSMPPAPGIR